MTCKLLFKESASLDTDRLGRLYVQYGDSEADRVICEGMAQLACELAAVSRARERDDPAGVCAGALALRAIGARLGMPKLRRVAGDVLECARAGDQPAVDATIARLRRVGNCSLTEIWNPRGQRC